MSAFLRILTFLLLLNLSDNLIIGGETEIHYINSKALWVKNQQERDEAFLIPAWVPIPIPKKFKKGEPIDQVIFISDVDGVVREGFQECANLEVVKLIRELANTGKVDIAFLSGTPISSNQNFENRPIELKELFFPVFAEEIMTGKIEVYGNMGGQRLLKDGKTETLLHYSSEQIFNLTKHFYKAFLLVVLDAGNLQQKRCAEELLCTLGLIISEDEFQKLADKIREIDPLFCLMNRGSMINLHTDASWDYQSIVNLLKVEINNDTLFQDVNTHIGFGKSKHGTRPIHFVNISQIDKGEGSERYLTNKSKLDSNALVICIGDTQIDISMYKNSDLAFHVGSEQVCNNCTVEQVVVVRDSEGADSAQVEGNITVLNNLLANIGKSFHTFRYIPLVNSNNVWGMYSIEDLCCISGCSSLEELAIQHSDLAWKHY